MLKSVEDGAGEKISKPRQGQENHFFYHSFRSLETDLLTSLKTVDPFCTDVLAHRRLLNALRRAKALREKLPLRQMLSPWMVASRNVEEDRH